MIDTHCHIHMDEYGLDAKTELAKAKDKGVETVILIGEGAHDSQLALEFAQQNDVYFTVGLHPHQASSAEDEIPKLRNIAESNPKNLVAIGECGLDYYYMNSTKEEQKIALVAQLELATELKLPLVFHLRGSKEHPHDAFADFYTIVDSFEVDGVIHSFTATSTEVKESLKRNFYIGLNGIVTFSNDEKLLQAVKIIPADKILLETDAPFLTPKPFRGKINTPQYVVETAQHISNLRGESFAVLETASTENAKRLFRL